MHVCLSICLSVCLSVGNTLLPQFPRTLKTTTTFVNLIILICISSFYSNNLLILCMSVCGNTLLLQFPKTLKTTTTFVNLIIFYFVFLFFYSNRSVCLLVCLFTCLSVCLSVGNTLLLQFPRTLKTTTTFENLIIF